MNSSSDTQAGVVREAAVAGLFYPAETQACDRQVASLLRDNPYTDDPVLPKAIIVPHAGYSYSGGIAAKAYNMIAGYAADIKRVVLMGPSHRVPLATMALSSADFFRSPLGLVAVGQVAQAPLMNSTLR